jgi:hypothetical protein
MLRVRKHEIEDGKYVILFTCDHQTPLPEIADERACELGGRLYRCGMELRHKNPKRNLYDACPGGYMACGDCYGVVSKFWKAGNDAKAKHAEWSDD